MISLPPRVPSIIGPAEEEKISDGGNKLRKKPENLFFIPRRGGVAVLVGVKTFLLDSHQEVIFTIKRAEITSLPF